MSAYNVNNYLPPVYNFNDQEPAQSVQFTPASFLEGEKKISRQKFYKDLDRLKIPKYYGRKLEKLTEVAQWGAIAAVVALIGILFTYMLTLAMGISMFSPLLGGFTFGVYGSAIVVGLTVLAIAGCKRHLHQTKKIGKKKIQNTLNKIVKRAEKAKARGEVLVNRHAMLKTHFKTTERDVLHK